MSYTVTTDELVRIVLMPLGLADGKPSCDLTNEAVEELRARIKTTKAYREQSEGISGVKPNGLRKDEVVKLNDIVLDKTLRDEIFEAKEAILVYLAENGESQPYELDKLYGVNSATVQMFGIPRKNPYFMGMEELMDECKVDARKDKKGWHYKISDSEDWTEEEKDKLNNV